MSAVSRIEITTHELALDPPFCPAWDPRPRTAFRATVVRVFDTEGRIGIGGGAPLSGFGEYAHLFVGEDALDIERHHAVLANIDFHAARPWAFEVALWDLAGKAQGTPLWKLLGGTAARVRAYASSGVLHDPTGAIALARTAIDGGFPALKLRFGRATIDEDVAVVRAVRDAVGDRLELMVDCNQGWRMPWDTQTPWSLEQALDVAQRLEPQSLCWIEEPLHRGDYAGYAELRRLANTRIAGGEMTREPYEFRELLAHECLDIFQSDCVLSLGITGVRDLAREIAVAGKLFTPHTWGDGIGLMANLHVAAAAGAAPFVEYPFDPPQWIPEGRDFLLGRPIEVDAEGWVTLPDAPGLGVELDEKVLAATEVARETFG